MHRKMLFSKKLTTHMSFLLNIHSKVKTWENFVLTSIKRPNVFRITPQSQYSQSEYVWSAMVALIVATQTQDSSHFNYDCVTLCNNSHPLFVIRTILKVRSMFSARHHHQTCGSCHQTNNKSGM